MATKLEKKRKEGSRPEGEKVCNLKNCFLLESGNEIAITSIINNNNNNS